MRKGKTNKSSKQTANQEANNENNNKREGQQDANRPRNFYVTDATQPFMYSFKGRFGIQTTLTIHQSPAEETWPGGALWDLGVLLANTILGMAGFFFVTTTTTSNETNKSKSKHHAIQLPPELAPNKTPCMNWLYSSVVSEKSIILELGCGVGLTGLAAAAALRPSLVILSDLQVVVEKVTQINLELNTQLKMRHRLLGPTKCMARHLCWGNEDDERAVSALIREHQEHQQQQHNNASHKRKTKNNTTKEGDTIQGDIVTQEKLGKPNIVLIGDVAYQHKPGALSHFDALHSTLTTFLHDETVVIFGTRIRMPASDDLLMLFLQDLDHIIPPIPVHHIEPLFQNVKHNMTIHFLKRKNKK